MVRKSICVSLFILMAALGTAASAQSSQTPNAPPLSREDSSLFREVFSMVLQSYVDPKTPSQVIQGALSGAVGAAGPECAYIPPEGVPAYRTLLANPDASLPLYVTKGSDFARVISVLPGADAQIRPSDALRYIGSRSTYDMTYPEILEAIHGKAGQAVECIFLKQKTWQSYTATLKFLPLPAPKLSAAGGAQIVRLAALESTPAQVFTHRLEAGKGTVLIDLRGSASGSVADALRWAGYFLGEAKGPVSEGQSGKLSHALKGEGVLKGRSIRVLINQTTARGGEVLATALIESGALCVGEPSMGFAPFYEDFPVENGGLVHLVTAYFVDPGGQMMNGHSIQPAAELKQAKGESDEAYYQRALKAKPKAPSKKASDAGRHAA